jgi:hypothetical protein
MVASSPSTHGKPHRGSDPFWDRMGFREFKDRGEAEAAARSFGAR